MKIIQSFWTGKKETTDPFGWVSSKYHYLGWILSVNQMRKFYDEVELFTDQRGYEILVNILKLPYTNVHIVLDELNRYNSGLWALPKIKSYSLMKEPFLHVDGDVFIWKPFPEDLLNSDLITQNQEIVSSYYHDMWANISPNLTHCSSYLKTFERGDASYAYNMGIFGGHDLKFIKKYTEASFDFVDSNVDSHNKLDLFNFNIFFEQVLFYEMAKFFNKKVNVLIKEDIGDNEYKGFGNFDEIPTPRTYLHLLGFFKRQIEVCRKLEMYVLKYYPEFYKRLELYLNFECIKGYKYTLQNNQELINGYHKGLLNKNQIEKDQTRRILSRNLFMEGQLNKFLSMEENQLPFFIVPTSDFEITYEENQIKNIVVSEMNNDSLTIPFLNIDHIIFNQFKKGSFTKKELNRNALKYLSDCFPEREKQNFINTLWKRISYLISLGVLVALPKNIKDNVLNN